MKRYLLDTNSAAHFIFKRRGVLARATAARAAGAKIGIAVPVVAELLAGAEFSDTRDRNLQEIQRGIGPLVVWPFTLEAAHAYAKLYAAVRRSGRTVGQVDLMIAAISQTFGDCTAVTSDSDFSLIPGISIKDWEV